MYIGFTYNYFFFQAEDGIRDHCVTGVQTVLFRSIPIDGGLQRAPSGENAHGYLILLVARVASLIGPSGAPRIGFEYETTEPEKVKPAEAGFVCAERDPSGLSAAPEASGDGVHVLAGCAPSSFRARVAVMSDTSFRLGPGLVRLTIPQQSPAHSSPTSLPVRPTRLSRPFPAAPGCSRSRRASPHRPPPRRRSRGLSRPGRHPART